MTSRPRPGVDPTPFWLDVAREAGVPTLAPAVRAVILARVGPDAALGAQLTALLDEALATRRRRRTRRERAPDGWGAVIADPLGQDAPPAIRRLARRDLVAIAGAYRSLGLPAREAARRVGVSLRSLQRWTARAEDGP